MSSPFVGEIRMFAGSFPPQGYMLCNGQLLSIAQYSTLFALIGTFYGGDGQSTFALPNLQGRFPVGSGQGPGLQNQVVGQMAGTETVTLLTSEIPAHTHSLRALSSAATETSPANHIWAGGGQPPEYSSGGPAAAMKASALGTTGGSQPHENMTPFLTINFIIAFEGIFPSRN